jgi:glutamate-1-semialdehyde aminotransferase
MEAAQGTFISSTYWTERIGPTAALATIKKHQRLNVGDHLMTIGKQIQEGWQRIASKNGLNIEVGGIPPLSHFSFREENPLALKALFVQWMLEKGFLASTLFYAMYAHTTHHVEEYLRSVNDVFTAISQAKCTGNLEKQLKGPPASAGFKRLT